MKTEQATTSDWCLTLEQIKAATDLSTSEVEAAMERGGYSRETRDDVLIGTKYLGMTPSGKFTYEVTFSECTMYNEEVLCHGRVFIQYQYNGIKECWELHGDY